MKIYVDFFLQERKGKNDLMLLNSSNRLLSRVPFPYDVFLFEKIQDADNIILLVLSNTYQQPVCSSDSSFTSHLELTSLPNMYDTIFTIKMMHVSLHNSD